MAKSKDQYISDVGEGKHSRVCFTGHSRYVEDFRQCSTPEKVQEMCDAIKKSNGKVTSIFFGYVDMGLREIGNLLRTYNMVSELGFSHAYHYDAFHDLPLDSPKDLEEFGVVCDALKTYTGRTILDLSQFSLGQEALVLLTEAIRDGQGGITGVNLGFTYPGDYRIFFDALTLHDSPNVGIKSVKSVDLLFDSFNDEDFQSFERMLSTNTTLETFILANSSDMIDSANTHDVVDVVCKTLGSSLLSAVTSLTLDGAIVSEEDLINLLGCAARTVRRAQDTPFSKRVKSLVLFRAGMTDGHATIIGNALHRMPHLEALCLAQNEITNAGLISICKGILQLPQLSALKDLDLSFNYGVEVDGMNYIANAIGWSHSLIRINANSWDGPLISLSESVCERNLKMARSLFDLLFNVLKNDIL